MYKNASNQCIVMKVIPIEGTKLVNGEPQKKYDEILSEIIISKKLNALKTNHPIYRCEYGFVELINVKLVSGCYPKYLVDQWELYDEIKGSENDSPTLFDEDQLYVVLELANGGQDIESYQFRDARMAFSIFIQVNYINNLPNLT